MIIKSILVLGVLYVLVGVWYAARFSMSYDPNVNSVPNNAVTFFINILTWPL